MLRLVLILILWQFWQSRGKYISLWTINNCYSQSPFPVKGLMGLGLKLTPGLHIVKYFTTNATALVVTRLCWHHPDYAQVNMRRDASDILFWNIDVARRKMRGNDWESGREECDIGLMFVSCLHLIAQMLTPSKYELIRPLMIHT